MFVHIHTTSFRFKTHFDLIDLNSKIYASIRIHYHIISTMYIPPPPAWMQKIPNIAAVAVHIFGCSACSLILSYQNIKRLRTYEKQSEKAAEWSNTAAQRLRKTRLTQAAGTAAVCSGHHPRNYGLETSTDGYS
jgi:hypothetical protein